MAAITVYRLGKVKPESFEIEVDKLPDDKFSHHLLIYCQESKRFFLFHSTNNKRELISVLLKEKLAMIINSDGKIVITVGDIGSVLN